MSEREWRIEVAGPARRDLERLPVKAATAVLEAITGLAEDPRRRGNPLRRELAGRWSARRGPYRIVYALDEERRTITVLLVAHRAHAYRPR